MLSKKFEHLLSGITVIAIVVGSGYILDLLSQKYVLDYIKLSVLGFTGAGLFWFGSDVMKESIPSFLFDAFKLCGIALSLIAIQLTIPRIPGFGICFGILAAYYYKSKDKL